MPYSPWACRILLRNQLITLLEFTCMLFIIFHLLLFFFFSFNYYVSWHVLPWVYSAWDTLSILVWASWTWVTASFPMLGMFSAIISSDIFSGSFSLYSPSGTPIMWILVHLILSQRSLSLSSLLFILIFSFPWQWFSPFCLPCHLICSSTSVIQL